MRVEYPFDAESDSEMSIVPGELVSVIEEVDAGWYIGEIVGSEFRTGMFPATYCVIVPSTASVSEVGGTTPVRRSTLKPPSPTSTKSDDSLEDQVANLSLRRPATVPVSRPNLGGRSVSSGSPASVGGKKKAPPPPVSRGSKPVMSGSSASSVSGDVKCRECGCDEFRANVFKKGSCNNCFHVHIPQ
jgi:hypothetical protein